MKNRPKPFPSPMGCTVPQSRRTGGRNATAGSSQTLPHSGKVRVSNPRNDFRSGSQPERAGSLSASSGQSMASRAISRRRLSSFHSQR